MKRQYSWTSHLSRAKKKAATRGTNLEMLEQFTAESSSLRPHYLAQPDLAGREENEKKERKKNR